MAENSKIEWTTHTFNPWRGCTKVSDGCKNCYAETMSGRNPKTLGIWGPNGTRVVASEAMWNEPLKWDCAAKAAGERHRVFCASLADVFEDWQGPMSDSNGQQLFNDDHGGVETTMQDVRNRLFRLIDAAPNLDWLLLTKRPENVLQFTFDAWCKKVPGHVSQNEGDGRRWEWPKNVWLGASVENQATADERIPHLLKVPAAVRFLSMEPLLGPVYLDQEGFHLKHASSITGYFPSIDWVIVGGESGHNARPMQIEWAESIVEQCRSAGVACFVKQLGGTRDKRGDMAAFPESLRVRDFPKATA